LLGSGPRNLGCSYSERNDNRFKFSPIRITLLYFGTDYRIDSRTMYRLNKLRMTKKILFILYLALSVLFVQWAQFHIHIYEFHTDTSDHTHLGQVHNVYDVPEIEHHDKLADVDLTHEGLIKNLLLGSLFIAILMIIFIVLLPRLYTSLLRRRETLVTFIPWRNSLPPPLRAPPL
jgi:uncharacterized membrane protein